MDRDRINNTIYTDSKMVYMLLIATVWNKDDSKRSLNCWTNKL